MITYKPSIIMGCPGLARRIGAQLRKKSEDIYLLYSVLLQTGTVAHAVSQMTVREMRAFMERNEQFLNEELMEYLNIHMEFLNEDDYFFVGHRSKDHSKPISKQCLLIIRDSIFQNRAHRIWDHQRILLG